MLGFPPPLWGRDREGGKSRAQEFAGTPLPIPPPQGWRERETVPPSPNLEAGPPNIALRQIHIFEVAGLVVDADFRRRDPAGEFAGREFRLHQAFDEVAVRRR